MALGESDVPVVPDDPEVPALPLVPEVPEDPEVPDDPEVPVVPLVPDVPVVPLVPEVPVAPDVPDVPLDPEGPTSLLVVVTDVGVDSSMSICLELLLLSVLTVLGDPTLTSIVFPEESVLTSILAIFL